MANIGYFFDRNGNASGYGTLNGDWDTTTASWTTSSTGTTAPVARTFSSTDWAEFVSPNGTTFGTVNVTTTPQINWLYAENTAGFTPGGGKNGTMTINASGSGKIILHNLSTDVNYYASISQYWAQEFIINAPIDVNPAIVGYVSIGGGGGHPITITNTNNFTVLNTLGTNVRLDLYATTLRVASGALYSGSPNNIYLQVGPYAELTSNRTDSQKVTLNNNIYIYSSGSYNNNADYPIFGDTVYKGPLEITGRIIRWPERISVLSQVIFSGEYNQDNFVGNASNNPVAWKKLGAGSLRLNSSGTYYRLGSVTIEDGEVMLAAPNSGTPNQVPYLSSGTITLSSANSTITYAGSNAATAVGTISGSGTLCIRNTSSAGVSFSSFSSFTGGVKLYADAEEGGATVQNAVFSVFPSKVVFENNGSLQNIDQCVALSSANGTISGNLELKQTSGNGSVKASAAVKTTLSSGTLTVSGNVVLLNTGSSPAGTFTASASSGTTIVLNGSVSEESTGILEFAKTGAGTCTIGGATGYKGTTSISDGILNLTFASGLGSSTSTAAINISGGALRFGAQVSITSKTINLAGVTNPGYIDLNHAGPHTVSTLNLSGLGGISANISGTLNVTTLTTNDRTVVLSAKSGAELTANFTASGSGGVTYGRLGTDTGVVIANRSHTYSGTTTLTYGSARVDVTGTPGVSGPFGSSSLSAAGTIVMNGGTLMYGTSITTDYSGRFSDSGSQQWIINTNGNNVSFGSSLLGTSSSLSKLGSGTLTLSGANTFTGGVTVTDGVLELSSLQVGSTSGPLGVSGTINMNGGNLKFTSNNTSDYSSRLSSSGSQSWKFDTNNQTVSFSSPLTGSGSSLEKLGEGTLSLSSSSNSYTGSTTVTSGSLVITSSGRLGSGSYSGSMMINGTFMYQSSQDQILNGALSGSGIIQKQSTSTLTLSSSSSTLSGTVKVDSGKLMVSNRTVLADSTLEITSSSSRVQISSASGQNGKATFSNLKNVYGGSIIIGS